jgi:hypothetical protein
MTTMIGDFMMRKFTGARPVRFIARQGWVECPPHMAQRWQPVLANRVLSTPPYSRSKRDAIRLIEANILRHAPLPRNYQFGKRMETRSENVNVVAGKSNIIMERRPK